MSELHVMANQTEESEKNELLQSIRTLLRSVVFQSCSISVVPEGLKKSNEDAYLPRKVSMGPRFKGKREGLLQMEEVKLSCMVSLLHRGAGEEVHAGKSLEQCIDAIWKLDERVRESYQAGIESQKQELATIMLVDGCFLLELLMSKGLDSQLPSRLPIPSHAAVQMIKDEDVLSDLMLFENQIPILVLHTLSQTLFPEVFEPDREEYWRESRMKIIDTLALSLLGYSPLQLPFSLKAPHILDLVHSFVNRRTGESTSTQSQEEGHVVMNIIETTQTLEQQLKLKRCALRLLTSGITLKAKLPEDSKDSDFDLSCFSFVWKSLCAMLFRLQNILILNGKHLDLDHTPEDMEVKGLDFYFKFQKGKLEIEQLHITKTTQAKWCNLIAWEHHKKYRNVSGFINPNYEGTNISTAVSRRGGGDKFTWAALIFNGLICSEDDVQHLKNKNIIVDHLKMSNQELMEFFRKIVIGVDHKIANSSTYIQMVDDINNFSKAFFIKRIWRTVLTSFTYRQEWLLRFMNRNYNFVATVVSVLAVVQTVYTILAYYFPK